MSWRQPISINLHGPQTRWERTKIFFGHYDLRVFITPDAYIDVGAGSVGTARKVVPLDSIKGSLGQIGRYCEFAACSILYGGDHANERPINICFSSAPVPFGGTYSDGRGPGVRPAQPVRIGNNVVIGHSARVLNGVRVGDGAVVAAGAIVVADVEPFSIVGGVPARKLSQRFSEENTRRVSVSRWWDFSASYLGEVMATLDEIALLDGPHQYARNVPRFAFYIRDEADGVDFLGAVDNERIVAPEGLPRKVLNYAEQAFGGGPYSWVADIWAN